LQFFKRYQSIDCSKADPRRMEVMD